MKANLVDVAKSMAGKHKWIKKATKDKGALHRHLGVPEGEKIPEDKLRGALNSGSDKIRKEAQLAVTLGKMHGKKKGKSTKDRISKMYGNKNG